MERFRLFRAADMSSGIVGARPFSAQGFAVLKGNLRWNGILLPAAADKTGGR
jgi:hypothetical protein